MAEDRHPSAETLKLLVLGKFQSEEVGEAVRHLLRGCSHCSRVLRGFQESGKGDAEGGSDGRYKAAFQWVRSTLGRRAAELAQEADDLTNRIESLTHWEDRLRKSMVLNSPKYRTWALCQALLEESAALRFRDPRGMLDLAGIATLIADNLEEGHYGPELIADLQAEAWAALANARRVSEDLAGAEHAMDRAFELRRRGTGDPLLRAQLLSLAASLHTDHRRMSTALSLLDQAYQIYQAYGQADLAGRLLIQKGGILGEVGRSEDALLVLEEGLALIDRRRDPRLACAAIHNLIALMAELGRYEEARVLLETSRALYSRAQDPINHLKMRWVEGKIAAGLGNLKEAELALLAVRREFQALDLPYEAALVSLELSLVLLRRERPLEARLVVEHVLETFRALGINREATAALLILKRAFDAQEATALLLRRVAVFVRLSRYDASVRFRA